jgi:pimeloyl-ACP methyl ester carboxylesterase
MDGSEQHADDVNGHHYHYLDSFPGSFVLLSPSASVQSAIVFVHGFGGDACGTWSDFQLLSDDIDSFPDTDLYFFQYHSVTEWIHSSTDRFLKFVDALIFSPKKEHFRLNIAPLRAKVQPEGTAPENPYISALPAKRAYSQILVVGHSEGGVVIRNAVVKEKQRDIKSPLLHAKLSLFAPAISGFTPAGLLGMLANFPGIGAIMHGLLSASPAYRDLKRPKFLEELQKQTEQLARDSEYPALYADILWGRSDYVVHPTKYECDSEDFEECNHIEICKPRRDYLEPIDFILGKRKRR